MKKNKTSLDKANKPEVSQKKPKAMNALLSSEGGAIQAYLDQTKTKKREVPVDGPYLTKRILDSKSRKAVREAAKETMEIMGYLVIAQDGWIVKKFQDGRIERISEIEHVNVAFRLD